MRFLFGGDSSPTVGDGYRMVANFSPPVFRAVLYEPSDPSSEVDKSNPPERRQISNPVSPKTSSPPPEAYQSPVSTAGAEQRPPSEALDFVQRQDVSSSRSGYTSRQPLRGCRAPPTSPMPDSSPDSPTMPPLSPIGTDCSSPSTPKPGPVEWRSWEDYEVPDELGIVKEQIPREIRDIILESLNERRALRASRLQQEAVATQTEIERPAVDEVIDEQETRESFTNASTHTSPSEYRGSQSTQSMSSYTTVGSENDDLLLRHQSLKPPPSVPPSPKPAPLSPQMAQVEFLLQQSKARTTRSRKLFKILPTSRKSQGRPNTPEASQQTQPPSNTECTGCFDDIPTGTAVAGLACNHKYCPLCFTQLILTSSRAESTFPPKCCLLDIPTTIIRSHLSPRDTAAYDQKALEYAVPIADRYYCPHPPCARWIDTRLATRNNSGFACPHCRQNICTVCRGPSHPSNQDCPQDSDLNRALEQAEQAGWQRCFKCRTLIERNQGCRHITCKCGGEFCYTCGKPWHTCACTDADQARLDNERAVQASRREAEARREEEEIDAAIAAVERAELQLAEERAAEERRAAEEAAELVRREEVRVVQIGHHFEYLRQVLETVKGVQRTAIETRHQASLEMITQLEQHRARIVTTRQREIREEEEILRSEGKRMIEMLQRKHAYAMIETIARHRSHQETLCGLDLSDHVSRNPYQVARQSDALKDVMLKALLPMQELEVAELKVQQARELKKWRGRTEKAIREHGTDNLCLQVRKEEKDKVRRMVEEGRRREGADWKWFEVLFEERVRMLAEDEARFVRIGADPPPPCRAPPPPPTSSAQRGSGGLTTGTEDAARAEADGRDAAAEPTSDGDLNEYVRLRGWSGTPNFGLGMQMESGLGVAVGG